MLPQRQDVISQSSAARAWTPEQQSVIDAVSRGPVGIDSDFDRWADGYGSDWTYWRMGSAETRPRDVHMDLVRGVVEDGNRITAFEMEPVDVVVMGDVAQLRYNAEETIVGPDGTVTVVDYSAVALLVREDGRWLLRTSSLFYPEG